MISWNDGTFVVPKLETSPIAVLTGITVVDEMIRGFRQEEGSEFSPQLTAIVEAIERRILPAFHEIDKEAEAVADDTWKKFMSMAGTGEEDPSELAEAAQDAGVSHYMLLNGIRQGIINLFAAA